MGDYWPFLVYFIGIATKWFFFVLIARLLIGAASFVSGKNSR